jgi:hypothetical protein
MKPLRVLLIGVGVLLFLLLVAFALLFSTGVQTWAARRALDSQPDIRGEIGRVSVGLNHVQAQDVVLHLSGMTVHLPSLDMTISVLGAARERIEIRRLVAKGWVVDLTAPVWDAAAAEPRVFQAGVIPLPLATTTGATPTAGTPQDRPFPLADVLAALELPVDLIALDGVELEGEVIFPTGPESAPGRARVNIAGGGVAPGREGTFQITSQADLAAAGTPVARLDLRAQVQARMANPRQFARVATNSTVDAHGETFPGGARLFIDAVAGSAAEGGHYTVQVRTPQKPLFSLEARPVSPGVNDLAGNWRLEVNDGDVRPFALAYPLPEFVAEGDGTVTFSGADQGMSLAGRLQSRLSRLEVIRPELQTVGWLAADINFEARRAGDDVRLTQLRVQVQGERPVAEITALQGVEYNLETGEVRVADPDLDLVDLRLHGLPLEWAQPFLGDLTVTGGPLQGHWIAAARDGGFVLRPSAPMRVGAVTVTQAGQPLVQGVDVAMSVSGEYTPTGWQGRVERGHVQSGTTRLVEFDARAGQASAKGAALVATTRFQANVGALLAQPVAEPYRVVQAGTANGDIIVALSENMEKIESAAKLEVIGLQAATGEALPRIVMDVRADRAPDGRIEAHVPVLVTQDGRASDLTLHAQVRPVGEIMQIDALLSGQHVFVQDVQLLALPFAGAEETPDEPTDPIRPVWAGVEGRIALSFGRVVYTDALAANNVEGEVRITADGVEIPNFRAALPTGGSVDLAAQVRYDAEAQDPYVLQGQLRGTQIDAAPLIRSLAPGGTAPVNGRFELSTSLSGRAADLAQLGQAASAEARLTSRGGTLYGLGITVAEVAKGANTLANVAGLIGAIRGDNRVPREVEWARAAASLAQTLSALNFDQLNVEVARRPGQDLQVKDISVISPTIRLLGTGAIADRPGVSVWQSPLQLRMQLSARDSVAANLRTLGLLREDADPLGYLPMVEDFRLEGSLVDLSNRGLSNLVNRYVLRGPSQPPPAAPPAGSGAQAP